tara:strand:+ start:219 stop:434 length:216 start_codon:yes stop_codon:yes gene_type:complete
MEKPRSFSYLTNNYYAGINRYIIANPNIFGIVFISALPNEIIYRNLIYDYFIFVNKINIKVFLIKKVHLFF